MGEFLEQERHHQIAFKRTSPYFSEAARLDGVYAGRSHSSFLPDACVAENLWRDIRTETERYFADFSIQWNQRGHVCSSQTCCINFLMPFATRADALKALLLPRYPTIDHMLPTEAGRYVAFEWIGAQNYLGEKVRGARTRGANCTSADAAVMFARNDGTRQIVLIEWKYSESYSSKPLAIADSGTDRTAIYAHLYERADCPLNRALLPSFEALFYEPFYQLMRQQFLAHEMERAHELGAGEVTVLHIAPERNRDFRAVTSPQLEGLGDSAIEVWKCIAPVGKFASASTESLFRALPIAQYPDLADWWHYLTARYRWLAPS